MTDSYIALANALMSGPERFYVFSLDWLDTKANLAAMQQYMKDLRIISSWAYYTPGVFLLRSQADVHILADALTKVAGGAHTLLIEANPANAGGWLPAHAWEWINAQRAPVDWSAPRPTPPGLINALALPQERDDKK